MVTLTSQGMFSGGKGHRVRLRWKNSRDIWPDLSPGLRLNSSAKLATPDLSKVFEWWRVIT